MLYGRLNAAGCVCGAPRSPDSSPRRRRGLLTRGAAPQLGKAQSSGIPRCSIHAHGSRCGVLENTCDRRSHGNDRVFFTKITFVLQACVLTWELLLDPIIAANAGSAFLLRERIIANDPGMAIFRWGAIVSILLSTILFGLAVYRSKEFPSSALVLIIVGAVAYAIGPMISITLAVVGVIALSAGCILIGARLWRAPEPGVRAALKFTEGS